MAEEAQRRDGQAIDQQRSMTLRVLARRRAGVNRCRGEQHRGASAPL